MVGKEDFSGHTYDWNNMLDNYGPSYLTNGHYIGSTSYDDVQAEAVSKLMADIGKVFGTMYGPGGSPTPFTYQQLADNFSFEPGIVSKSGLTAADLQEAMKAELDENRPVIYCGHPENFDPANGHALVCDGYTDKDYFHFNYGWGGSCDGFYKNAMCQTYSNHVYIWTGVRPYDAVHKMIGDIEYGLLKNGTAEILHYQRKNESGITLEIPATVTDDEGKEYTVTRVCKQAFMTNCNFDKVIIGENVKAIDRIAFFNCRIDELVLSDKMEEVPDEAFQTTAIRKLTIGANIKRIGRRAFYATDLTTVTSKSPAFEVDEMAFSGTGEIDSGDWLRCITKLGRRAFGGKDFTQDPPFDNLTEVGAEAFYACSFKKQFTLPSKLRAISPDAFKGAQFYGFEPNDANPYFDATKLGLLYNKNQTSLVLAPLADMTIESWMLPETLVKLEPGSVVSRRSQGGNMYYGFEIPNTVVEMEGAFNRCETLGKLKCLAVVPPVISDTTFNDKIFTNKPNITLYVPQGTAELYRHAPGWRRFPNIVDDQEYTPMAAQGREYYMQVHYNDDDGHHRVNMPVGEVGDMQLDESGTKMVLSRPGKENLAVDVVQVDSITWMNGFVYDNAEVFDLNDSTLTAVGQKCTVVLSSSVIDRDVQLCIRNGVIMPKMSPNMTRGVVVDVSLSTGEHELTGTAKIIIPFEKTEGEKLKAVYFNRETGQWESVYFKYDEEQRAVVIPTNHFTEYGVCSLRNVEGPMVEIEKLDLGIYDLNGSLKKLYNIVSKDNIDKAAIQAWRDDYGFWQSIGIDGGWNALQACGFSDEAIGKACDVVGYLGTAMTVLDVAAADLQRDDIGVASNTMKAICGFWTGQMASAIGTSIMQTSMIGVCAIAILLDKFGTLVQKRKKELIRAAYRHYYSMEGVNTVRNHTRFKDGDLSHDYFGREQKYPNNQYRSKKDWHLYFKPVLEEGKIKPDNFRYLIEQAVRRYCDRFWEDDYLARTACYEKAKSWGLTSLVDAEDNISLQQQISDEYYAELMAGDITEVFNDLRVDSEVLAGARYEKAEKDFLAIMNTVMSMRLYDSNWKKGRKSKYAGWKLRFADLPDDIPNPELWECTVADDGTAVLEFTKYALVKNKLKCKFKLYDDRGIEQKIYEYQISDASGKKLVRKVDLASGGEDIEDPELPGLELKYDPEKIEVSWTCEYNGYGEVLEHTPLPIPMYFDGRMNEKARFQTRIENFFKQHDFIVVDKYGNITIGDDMTGKFENNGLEGTGTFSINTTTTFTEKTRKDYVDCWNDDKNVSSFGNEWTNLLGGNIRHEIEGEFKITRSSVDSQEYEITYTGSGTFDFRAEFVDRVVNKYPYGENENPDPFDFHGGLTVGDISTSWVEQDGKVTLKYSTKLK
jgi:hypothetical protein